MANILASPWHGRYGWSVPNHRPYDYSMVRVEMVTILWWLLDGSHQLRVTTCVGVAAH